MEKANTGGLQYGVREILMLLYAIAYLLGFSKWFWLKSVGPCDFSHYLILLVFLLISGSMFFIIGQLMRNQDPDSKLGRMTHGIIFGFMVMLISLLCYSVFSFIHLQFDMVHDIMENVHLKLEDGWPYPDKAFIYLSNQKILASYRDIRESPYCEFYQLEFAIHLTFAPLVGGICFCLGLLRPARKIERTGATRWGKHSADPHAD